MTADATSRAAPTGQEPAASLMSVRVKRRKAALAPSGKPGDLTADGEPKAAAPFEPPRPVIVLPQPPTPPMAPALREALLPLAELLLPELEAKPEPREEPQVIALPAQPPEREPEAGPAQPDSPLSRWAGAPEPVAEEPELAPLELASPEESVSPPADAPAPFAMLGRAEEPVPMPEAAPLEEPGPVDAPPHAAQATPEMGSGPDILDYWDSLRGARNFPALDDLDRAHVGATWPNTVLVTLGQSELPRMTRIGENNGEIDYTAGVIDWIVARARTSARRGEPMEEEQRFVVSTGNARYRLLLLPFGSYGLACDHVLCQLARAHELSAVASFKRWLTG